MAGQETGSLSRIPENDITPFCLWLKEELKEHIGKVTISKRLKDTPAIISGNMSSSLRMMMQMMETHGQLQDGADLNRAKKESVFEINAGHPIVVNLNQLRKQNKVAAKMVAHQFLDSVLVQSGIPFDLQASVERQFKMLDSYLELVVNADTDSGATRASINDAQEVTIESGSAGKGDKQSAMKQARDKVNQANASGQKITIEHTVNDEDVSKK